MKLEIGIGHQSGGVDYFVTVESQLPTITDAQAEGLANAICASDFIQSTYGPGQTPWVMVVTSHNRHQVLEQLEEPE